METLEYKGYTIKYDVQDIPDNPRECQDNFGTMLCSHRRYNLGDKQLKNYGESFKDDLVRYLKDEGLKLSEVVYLPLYLYDHSGITMSTHPFECQWDSGQVGWIYISKKDIRKEYSVAAVKSTSRLRAVTYMRQEVKHYDRYLTGSIYKYCINDEWSTGYESEEDAIKYAKEEIDNLILNNNTDATNSGNEDVGTGVHTGLSMLCS